MRNGYAARIAAIWGRSSRGKGGYWNSGAAPAQFDAITLYLVLEHMPELDPFPSEIRRILNPSGDEKARGSTVIEVPNGGSLHSRLQKADWPYVNPRDHLYYFSSQSLPKLLRKHGDSDVCTLVDLLYNDFSR